MEGTYVVEETVGDDSCGADGETDGNHGVGSAGAVEVGGEGPGGGVGVIGLHGGTTPGGVVVAGGEEGFVTSDDGDHDGVVDEAAQDGAVDLGEEHHARGDFDCHLLELCGYEEKGHGLTVFAHLQVVG